MKYYLNYKIIRYGNIIYYDILIKFIFKGYSIILVLEVCLQTNLTQETYIIIKAKLIFLYQLYQKK